ncbi:protein phosphatase 2C domain-containing protein [Bacteroides acidifaciens]|uniref:PP2C family protein-serine/threonine phosphatase n=1 Tax=Bacteroides acidifaciens TaxID=85831 RepID=UPI00259AD2A5|nr:protein phosphatase 2C domain-containing protein [Bacteroides acidifaciens]
MELEINISLACDIGCGRSNNEDMILVSGEYYRDMDDEFSLSVNDNGRFVAAIADGMGGHNAGEIASEMALKSFDDFIKNLPEGLSDTDFRRMMDNEIIRIHKSLNQYGLTNAGCMGLGTTLVAWLTYDNKVYIINSGDSRLYRYRNGMLLQLTTDHSEQNRKGDSTIPSNQIYNCLGGGGSHVFADILDITTKVFDDDVFLLCSDGFSDILSDDEIEIALHEKADAGSLVNKVKAYGANDNVSIVLIDIKNKVIW